MLIGTRISAVHTHLQDGRLTDTELFHSASVFVIAGSETSATALSGLLYHVLLSSNSDTCTSASETPLEKLLQEIRSSFSSAEDITPVKLQSLPYLNACISETLRIFPPVTGWQQRMTPHEGCIVAGIHIPGDTAIAVNAYAASFSPLNFHRPTEFLPERWMEASLLTPLISDGPPGNPDSAANATSGIKVSEFYQDIQKSSQPFGFGPRNCIGKNLAWMEIRLIVARLLWAFDIELCDESKGWKDNMPIFGLYQRGPLTVKLTPVVRS